MRRGTSAVLCSIISSLSLVQTGCFTLIGVGVGHSLDLQEPDSIVYAADDLASVGSNVPARILPVAGRTRSATVIRPELEPDADYRERVSAVCTLASPSIPVPPQTLDAVIGRTVYRNGVLHGYGRAGIWFAPGAERLPFFLGWDRLSELLDTSGHLWTGEQLRIACATARVPSRLGLLVRPAPSSRPTLVDAGRPAVEFIPAADIRSVTVPHRTHHIWLGLVAGLAVDVTLAAVLLRLAHPFRFNFDPGRF